MSSKNNLGIRLKKLRTEMNLSQEDLASICNMQASHIGQIERNKKNPTVDTLEKLAAGLGITVSQLMDYPSEINVYPSKTIHAINAYLNKLNDKQQKQVLDIIKTFFDDN